MKVTVELSNHEMAEILDLAGERKKGPATWLSPCDSCCFVQLGRRA